MGRRLARGRDGRLFETSKRAPVETTAKANVAPMRRRGGIPADARCPRPKDRLPKAARIAPAAFAATPPGR